MTTTDLWYLSARDAARNTHTTQPSFHRALHAGKIPGVYQDEETGQWRIPVDGLLAAGYRTTGEGAHRIGPLNEDHRWQLLDLQRANAAIRADNARLATENEQLLDANRRLSQRLRDADSARESHNDPKRPPTTRMNETSPRPLTEEI